ncbi:MAG: hypothetical protein KDA75_12470, partial [Planctomycetaceae bacterium]|nr:hypothetical protein [Planctomycetaceae bacterium]
MILVGSLSRIDADDAEAQSPTKAFSEVDANQDGVLRLLEAWPQGASSAERRRFYLLDRNGDGVLSPEEWTAKGRHQLAVNLFRGRDTDDDGLLSEAELVVDFPAEQVAKVRQQLLTFDADRDGRLSSSEFARSPWFVTGDARGPVEDAIELVAEDRVASLKATIDLPLPIELWAGAARPVLGDLIPVDAQWWDVDGDGRISAAEVEAGVRMAYGIDRLGGGRARFGDSRVFNEHFSTKIDHDGDRILAGAELVDLGQRLSRSAEQIAEFDQNQDGQLDMAELDAAGWFTADVVREFLRWDADRDGVATASEFVAQARTYDARIAAEMLPVFDRNHDERIDLAEFIESPLADGSYLANDPRRDVDHNLVLGPDEFFPRGGLALSGLAEHYFRRWDANQNGQLELSEVAIEVDWKAVDPQLAMTALDQDGDGGISLEEHVRVIRGSNSRRRFFLLDADGDSVVNAVEWAAQGEHRTAVNLFRACDADQDGAISAVEWLEGLDEAAARKADRNRIVFDANGDGSLSLDEYSAIPGEVSLAERGPAPDPIVVLAEEQSSRLLDAVTTPAPVADWCDQARSVSPSSVPCQAAVWDANGDGSVDESEVRRGVQLAFGLIRPDGGIVRHSNGLSFYGRLMRAVDSDGDGQLNTGEFARYLERTREADREFTGLDRNRDGVLDLGEIDAGGLVRFDRVAAFLGWDRDYDGVLSWDEAREHSPSYFANIVSHLERFDTDASQNLSLAEYLASPLGESNRDWNVARTDADADGALSLAEYYPEQDLFLSWLAAHFFSRLDQDQDGRLSSKEATFRIDLDKVPPDVSFEIVDGDSDGAISLDEYSRHKGGLYGRRRYFTRDADRDGRLSRTE